MVQKYMIPVYAFLLKSGARSIETLSTDYQIPVAEYMASLIEEDTDESN